MPSDAVPPDEELTPPVSKLTRPEVGEDDYMVFQTPEAAANGLFPVEELFLPEEGKSFKKPVAAIHAVPVSLDATANLSYRKLMDALPMAVQISLRSRNKAEAQSLIKKIREDRAAPLFEIRTRELAVLAGLSVTNLDRIHDMLEEMVGFKIKWNVLNEDSQAQYQSVAAFVIRADRGVDSRVGYTRFAFEPEVLQWFLEPQMWASLSWNVLKGFGRRNVPGEDAAFGLYQNLWRYVGTPSKTTPAFDLAMLITLVMGRSRFVTEAKSGVSKVVDYKDFKRRHLLPGLALLNTHAALSHTVKMTEIKSGLKVIRLKFSFEEKAQASFEFPLTWTDEMLTELSGLGFREKDLKSLNETYVYEQIAEALKRLPGAESRVRASGKQVYSRKAFFTGVLRNVAAGEVQTAETEAKVAREAELQEKKETAERQQNELRQAFATHQKARIDEMLRGLPALERDALIQAHLAAVPSDSMMYKGDPFKGPYMALLSQWIIKARPDLHAEWLPAPEDQDFQSFLIWRVSQAAGA